MFARTKTGIVWMILKPLLIFGGVLAVLAFMAFPWAIPMPGRDTLSGRWLGPLHSNRGPQAWLFLNLGPDTSYRAPIFGFITGRGTPLGGRAALCTKQRRFEFGIAGDTTAWSGEALDILLRPVAPTPPDVRLGVKGRWDGSTLDLTETDVSLADILGQPPPPQATEPQERAWVSATLRKGRESEFASACGSLP